MDIVRNGSHDRRLLLQSQCRQAMRETVLIALLTSSTELVVVSSALLFLLTIEKLSVPTIRALFWLWLARYKTKKLTKTCVQLG